jgi:hypothetical protein
MLLTARKKLLYNMYELSLFEMQFEMQLTSKQHKMHMQILFVLCVCANGNYKA